MSIGDLCSREVVCAGRDTSVSTAARLMREYHVGSIVVVDEQEGRRRPAGIVTDRDVTVAVVAPGLDPQVIQIGDLIGSELVCVPEDAGVAKVVDLMRRKGLRRIVVTDASGHLAGIVAADDVLSLLAEEMTGLASMVTRERQREASARKSTA
ncbi:MAG TPA: CBS domain-containing protein [Burkholderiales bacterium]|nr:CBS domain-containing protein [Burkholderiales bacterium]